MRAHLLALALLALPTFATALPRPPAATPAPGAKAAATPGAPLSGSTPRVRGPGPFRVPGDLPRPARVIAIELHGEVTRGMAAFVERVTGSLASGDLLLLDIMMPGADGLQILARLRAHPKFARLPVIMMTGKADPADVKAGLAAGADGYVGKPFKMSALMAAVNLVLGRA